jgi:large subunit ribosomal protein L30e
MKKAESTLPAEIKKLFEQGKLVLGEERTMRMVKNGTAKKVYLSTTVKVDLKQDVERYASIAKIDVVEVPMTADEIGALCRKQFGVSILSVKA